jgi:hypothetical protein
VGRSIYPSRPRRAVPALSPAEWDKAVPLTPARQPRVMVRFSDGSWMLCRVLNWQQQRDRWLVHLAWGDSGTAHDGWFVHDPERVTGPPGSG